jgi:PAS domain S-box-containing protein
MPAAKDRPLSPLAFLVDRSPAKIMWFALALVALAGVVFASVDLYRIFTHADLTPERVVAFHSIAYAAIVIAIGTVAVARWRTVRSQRDVERTEEEFHALVSGVTDYAIYRLDPHGIITSWNAGAERIKGYAASEIIGQHFSRFYCDEDRMAGVPQAALKAALEQGRYEAEAWRMRKDGSRFWASVVIDRLTDPSGRVRGFAKITRDITEKRQAQQALLDAQAALLQSQKMESLGQLSGGIAHDFNNLLHVIKNGVEIVQRRLGGIDGDVARALEMIKRNADRGASLTQRLLAFSRRQPLQPTAIGPNRLVSGMAELLRSALGESIALETVLGSGTWPISVDPNQLETALLNLAVNARDAMPQGGKLTIETTNAYLDDNYAAAHQEVKPGQYAMIAVSDTGAGMTKEVAAKAFDPFFTTKEVGQGTGLGLSQVYGFIKQSGGHVKIYSELGAGTTVKLYLPRLVGNDFVNLKKEGQELRQPRGNETILVVEDDDDVCTFTCEILRDLGYRVMSARDARSALEALDKDTNVNLLFTDVGLPDGINGRQLADVAVERWPSLKVLFTTGYARNAIVHHGRLDPGVELVLKPFTQNELAKKVRRILESGS